MFLLVINALVLALLVACWAVGGLEFRTKVILTVVYVLTQGGPFDRTQVLQSLAFFTGILGSDLAAGAAISLFLVPLLVIIAYFMHLKFERFSLFVTLFPMLILCILLLFIWMPDAQRALDLRPR